ncbi:MAG: transposase, partial [bacterium]
MTRQNNGTVMEEVMELICEHGLGGLDQAISILVNEAMIIERSRVLQAEPYERTDHRQGYANGFKPKTLKTRIGELNLQIPQVRGGVSFYPSAIERGVRSERALKLAIAEMYLKGVSTRKVTAIVGELCG